MGSHYAKILHTFIFECYCCGETEKKRDWIYNLGTPYVVCNYCYIKTIKRDYYKDYNKRYFLFHKERLRLKEIPRIGVCNLCRAVAPFDTKKTLLHHYEYDEKNPLANTLEICSKCHLIIHWTEQYNGLGKCNCYKVCYGCGRNNKDYPQRWMINKGTDLFLCSKCRNIIYKKKKSN